MTITADTAANGPEHPARAMQRTPRWTRPLSWLAGGFLLAEIALRASGAVSFPLYHADTRVGYIPQASQSGTFLLFSDYDFNEHHMTGGPLIDTPLRKVLVVGDSVVYGGNGYRRADRLGPVLQTLMPEAKVWTLAAGGWAIRNELGWLETHQDVVARMNDVVVVINNTDFLTEAAIWRCETMHPTHRPWLATVYWARKVTKFDICDQGRADLRIPDGDWQAPLRQWIARTMAQGVRVHFVLYPGVADIQKDPAHATSATLAQLQATHPVHAVEVSRSPQWHSGLYSDAIHPNAQGNQVLAGVIRSALLTEAGR